MRIYRETALTFPEHDRARVQEAANRRNLLDGTWMHLLQAHMEIQLGPKRMRIVGLPDPSSNLFANVVGQTSTTYDTPPVATGDAAIVAALDHWWPLAGQHQRYVRGIQESLVYVGFDPGTKTPTYQLVTPNVVQVEVAATNPSRPVTIWWGRRRRTPKGTFAWFWDRWDIRDPAAPSLQIWTNDRRFEVTKDHITPSEWTGDAYPFRDLENNPLLPFALYHAQGCVGAPWYPYGRQEVVFGTLQVGMLWTGAVHGYLRSSWDQRVLLNGRVKGGTVSSDPAGGSNRYVTPDPTRILQVDGDKASIGAWGASVDLEKAERFCRLYESRLAVNFGLSAGDVVIESLNPASGASLTVSERGKRTIANRDSVNFRRGDQDLIQLVAAVLRANKIPANESGTSLRYSGIALTLDERERAVRIAAEEIKIGTMDRLMAYQFLNPGTTHADAIGDLAAIQQRAELELQTRERIAARVLELQGALGTPQPRDGEEEGQRGQAA